MRSAVPRRAYRGCVPDIPFGFALPGGQPPDPNDPQQMQQFMAQLQHLLAAPGAGPVNWDLARQVAASQLASAGDPAVTPYERNAVEEALRLADLWLEPASALPSGIRSSVAWNRNEWIYKTLDVWQKLCDPVAGRMVGAMGDLVPPEARAQLGPMQSMVATLGGALFGGQLGQALGSLAAEVLSAGDIGLPLGPAGTAALVPANIKEYGTGLELPEDEVRLYVALREAAHQRLFGHVPWLRGHVLTSVEAYASGITVNREAIEEAMGRVDPMNPESMQAMALEGSSPRRTPRPRRPSLARLETALALVEGWVCHIVDTAAGDAAAQRGPARRGVPSAPGGRWAGRADLRGAGRVGVAAPTVARGRRALGGADRASRHRGSGRALGRIRTCCPPATTSPTRRRSPGTQLDLGSLGDFDFDSAAPT